MNQSGYLPKSNSQYNSMDIYLNEIVNIMSGYLPNQICQSNESVSILPKQKSQ